jgi:SM-20-related protein
VIAAPAAAAASAFERVCDGIAENGFAMIGDFLPASTIAMLAADARQRYGAGAFRPAGIGRGATCAQRSDVRGDRILWLDDADAAPAVRSAMRALSELRAALNAALFLGLFSFEAHYAIYPPGACYRRHRDRFRDDDRRALSCVLYLNDGWTAADGGALRIYRDDDAPRDILPTAGTLVCFRSDDIEHEVLPATRERLSLTGWFRRRGAHPA